MLRRCGLLVALLIFITLLVFSNCLSFSFVWDDEHFILRNAYLTHPKFLPALLTHNIVAGAGGISNLYRPLESLTHFFDVQAWGYHPWGHHLTTVLIHAAMLVVLFLWLRRVAPTPAAFVATLLYGLHPMQTELVAYIPGRCDTLGLLFMLLAALAFRRRLWLSLLCAALAMASKENFVLTPLFILLTDRAQPQPAPWRRHIGLWLLSAGYVLLRLTLLNFANTLNFYGAENLLTQHPEYRLLTYFTTLPAGFRLWLWPADLHHERAWALYTSLLIPKVWTGALFLLAWFGLAAWLWRRSRMAAVGLLWFIAATLPTSNLIIIINALFYDHWFVVPGLGLAIAVSQLPLFRGRWQRHALIGGIALAAGLGWMTHRTTEVWRNGVTLNSHILRFEPDNPKIMNNLAMALEGKGKTSDAIQLYQRAIRASDEYPQTHHNLARAYETQGRLDDAIVEYHRALTLDPRFYYSAIALGRIRLSQGQIAAATTKFQEAIAAYPYAADAYLGLAQIRLNAGDRAGAITELRRGLAVVDDPRLRHQLSALQSAK